MTGWTLIAWLSTDWKANVLDFIVTAHIYINIYFGEPVVCTYEGVLYTYSYRIAHIIQILWWVLINDKQYLSNPPSFIMKTFTTYMPWTFSV